MFSDTRSHENVISNQKTPVWGVLTEPLRGTLKKNSDVVSDYQEYIPASHVKFLEQTGAKVIPVSYKLSRDELYDLLDQLSGLYLHGDSIEAVNDNRF